MLDIVLSAAGPFISSASIKLNPMHGILSGERITGLEAVSRVKRLIRSGYFGPQAECSVWSG